MPRQTYAELQRINLDLSYRLKQQTATASEYYKEIQNLRQQNTTVITDLQKQLNWHRQLSQNLSEAICAHMRNR